MKATLAAAFALLTLTPVAAHADDPGVREFIPQGGTRGIHVDAGIPGPYASSFRKGRHGGYVRVGYRVHRHRFHESRVPRGIEAAVAGPGKVPAGKAGIYAAVTRSAVSHGIPVLLAHAIVRMESGYDCSASNAGALGIMQVKAATAGAVGIHGGLRSCTVGLEAGMRYLKLAYVAAHGNVAHAATLYNRGLAASPAPSGYARQVVRLSRL